MARKKKHPEHVNHERWLISYADFITLLFAFFVVMFAVSQVDSKKVGRFTESFTKAIGIEMFPSPGQGFMQGATQGVLEKEQEKKSDLPDDLSKLKKALTGAGAGGDGMQILQRRNELVLRLSEGFMFNSGDDSLEDRARKVISKLAAELRDRPLHIRVEGHTDNRPIRTPRFRSNWDLSTARATAVVARLAAEGIEPERLSAAGYGEFHPVAGNDSDEGRKQNRRVDLIISMPTDLTETPVPKTEPQAEEKPAEAAKEHGADDGHEPAAADGDHGGHDTKGAHDGHDAKEAAPHDAKGAHDGHDAKEAAPHDAKGAHDDHPAPAKEHH